MRTARIVSGTLAVATLVASVAAQQQPTFRSGVDLMSVDVVALDKAGMPVSTLAAEDFNVTFAKKPRRVVSAEFVSSARPQRAAALRGAPAASSNRQMSAPRTLMFLVVIMGSTDTRAPAAMAPLAIGLALTLIHLISIPITNTSVNPARSTGPALVVGGVAMAQLWLFWVAPLLGGAIGGVLGRLLFAEVEAGAARAAEISPAKAVPYA